MKTSEQIGDLAAALAKAQGELKNVIKDSNNPFFKSKYASLDGVLDSVKGPLSKNGLSIIQGHALSFEGEGLTLLQTRLMHSSGQWIEVETPLIIPAQKHDMQGIGSATTYARRYALCAIIGLAETDDDGEAVASNRPTQAQPQKQSHLTPALQVQPKPSVAPPQPAPNYSGGYAQRKAASNPPKQAPAPKTAAPTPPPLGDDDIRF